MSVRKKQRGKEYSRKILFSMLAAALVTESGPAFSAGITEEEQEMPEVPVSGEK
jgi:hypothetical protein